MKAHLIVTWSVLMAVAVTTAQAIPISGSVNFAGSVSLDGDVDTATTATFGPAFTTAPNTGDYAAVPIGTVATFNDFTFAPFGSPIPDLWSFTFLGDVYSMTAESLTMLERNPGNPLGSIELRGTGTASITGFDDTPGVWIITFNTADNGATFSFSSSGSATPRVPDGGATLVLLGVALTGLGLIRRKLLS